MKMLRKSKIGKALLKDVSSCTASIISIATTSVPTSATDMNVGMIPQPNKDHSQAKA